MDFIKAWVRNLAIDLGAFVLVCIIMIIFMKIFYPDALGLIFLSGQFTIGMINVLQLWPIVILAIIVYAMPFRRRKQ
jgi:hypothetical protein